MHRRLGGLRPLEPGYRRFAVEPVPGDLPSAALSFESVFGRIDVSWTQGAAGFILDLTVPFDTEAEVMLPGETTPIVCGWGNHHLHSTGGN